MFGGCLVWLSIQAPPARLEHATLCSASKCSNPLSYEGILKTSGPYFTTFFIQRKGRFLLASK
jgi:hypothetical protein